MSSDVVIKTERVSKHYLIGQQERYDTFRDRLSSMFNFKLKQRNSTEFQALQDVSFEVRKGEVIGIIGRNGAGKSTLLKILSRITEPTSGRITLSGRVASLLEVGTGFHPELTGRENIFLNGAILGMKRVEITRKFDEIVAFAEVEQFLDTPVKRYSSGMYVRLAFAVAAHLEPEILIVDEVLAVGDAQFQKKCLGKIQSVATDDGRTVLFVSHNLVAVEMLTQRCLLLEAGRLTCQGSATEVVGKYLSRATPQSRPPLTDWPERRGDRQIEVEEVDFTGLDGTPQENFHPGEAVLVTVRIRAHRRALFDVAFALETASGTPLFASHLSDCRKLEEREGVFRVTAAINPNYLRHGGYNISFGIYSQDFKSCHDEYLHYPAFAIEGHTEGVPADSRWGAMYFPFQWEVKA